MPTPTNEQILTLPENVCELLKGPETPPSVTQITGGTSQSTEGGLSIYSYPDGTVSLPVSREHITLGSVQARACRNALLRAYGCAFLHNGACTAGLRLDSVEETQITLGSGKMIHLKGDVAKAFELAESVAQHFAPAYCDVTGHNVGILPGSNLIKMQGGTIRISPPPSPPPQVL